MAKEEFKKMSLKEKCEFVHSHFIEVGKNYKGKKGNEKNFSKREWVGKELGLNYRTVDRYNRIYNRFERYEERYLVFPEDFNYTIVEKICKLSYKGLKNFCNYFKDNKEDILKLDGEKADKIVEVEKYDKFLSEKDIARILNKRPNFDSTSPSPGIEEKVDYMIDKKINQLNEEDRKIFKNVILEQLQIYEVKKNRVINHHKEIEYAKSPIYTMQAGEIYKSIEKYDEMFFDFYIKNDIKKNLIKCRIVDWAISDEGWLYKNFREGRKLIVYGEKEHNKNYDKVIQSKDGYIEEIYVEKVEFKD